jgi:HD-GYP domain-containing protein (c-di-GMP phosphodiesterase class II)
MQEHTTIGATVLQEAAGERARASSFLAMAMDICGHHHERFDGTGYPDGLVGANIPLAARIVSLADTYDALRSRRPYRPALSHRVVSRLIASNSEGQFDPDLLAAFEHCSRQWEGIFQEIKE